MFLNTRKDPIIYKSREIIIICIHLKGTPDFTPHRRGIGRVANVKSDSVYYLRDDPSGWCGYVIEVYAIWVMLLLLFLRT